MFILNVIPTGEDIKMSKIEKLEIVAEMVDLELDM